jgi:REP element-mobilizing transposase RayT
MPRANRVFLPGHIWHITQRCHRRDFLLKHRRDRRYWLAWLLEARRRHGLCVLNYIVTRNHVHLLVRDRGQGEIAAAMQLVAGRTAQAYNDRKARLGAFWQDRYHATAVESDGHLQRCMRYIDLNMVRAGVVAHPAEWRESGYCEIQRLPQRYRIIDTAMLCTLLGCDTPETLRHRRCRLGGGRAGAWADWPGGGMDREPGGRRRGVPARVQARPRAAGVGAGARRGRWAVMPAGADSRVRRGKGFRVQCAAALEREFCPWKRVLRLPGGLFLALFLFETVTCHGPTHEAPQHRHHRPR